ncbi:MAG: flagellar basal body rod protein FlgC [Oscillospiraceae bacterium]|nr:flagellar basal body rod protein FlgC [Oscillospiraceae bacterium]
MNLFRAMDISASALTAERYRMDIAGENIANALTTRTADGGTYRRKYVLVRERPMYEFSDLLRSAESRLAAGGGVRVVATREDTQTPFRVVYDPQHPDADENGYVSLPNVDMEREMVDFLSATRAYDASVTAISNYKAIANRALQIGR